MTETRPITLLITDDHPVVRDGLSGMFATDPGFEVLGQAADGAEAVQLAQALRPDVILMDLRMPGMDGLTAIRELARRGSTARVLVLTTYDTDSYVLPPLRRAPPATCSRTHRATNCCGRSGRRPPVRRRCRRRWRPG
jgi:DNA-binding NarL/FixJ family response regulator